MLICINLDTVRVLVTTYMSYAITGMSELSSFKIYVLRIELFWAAFKSGFLTSFLPKEDCILLVFNGKVEWTFWFIHLCRTVGFEYFVVFQPDTVHGELFQKYNKTSHGPEDFQTMTVSGCSLRFPHKDFVASFRIVLHMKCRPTEDAVTYFWLEKKM